MTLMSCSNFQMYESRHSSGFRFANKPLNTLLETSDYRSKVAPHCCLNPTINYFYLGHVRGWDEPSAVSIVVILDRVVWGRDDTTGSFQLTSTHRCYRGKKERHREREMFGKWHVFTPPSVMLFDCWSSFKPLGLLRFVIYFIVFKPRAIYVINIYISFFSSNPVKRKRTFTRWLGRHPKALPNIINLKWTMHSLNFTLLQRFWLNCKQASLLSVEAVCQALGDNDNLSFF